MLKKKIRLPHSFDIVELAPTNCHLANNGASLVDHIQQNQVYTVHLKNLPDHNGISMVLSNHSVDHLGKDIAIYL